MKAQTLSSGQALPETSHGFAAKLSQAGCDDRRSIRLCMSVTLETNCKGQFLPETCHGSASTPTQANCGDPLQNCLRLSCQGTQLSLVPMKQKDVFFCIGSAGFTLPKGSPIYRASPTVLVLVVALKLWAPSSPEVERPRDPP